MNKRVLLFIICVSVVALTAFSITRWISTPTPLAETEQLAWLQSEFKLSPPQVAAIKILHEDYQPVCREHCKKIALARTALAHAQPSEIAAAQLELTGIENICRDATRAHLQRVAAVMDPAQATRFLNLVLPKLSSETHAAACELK
jgi:hypothetical protein